METSQLPSPDGSNSIAGTTVPTAACGFQYFRLPAAAGSWVVFLTVTFVPPAPTVFTSQKAVGNAPLSTRKIIPGTMVGSGGVGSKSRLVLAVPESPVPT